MTAKTKKKKRISGSTASKSYNKKTIAKMNARDAGKTSSTIQAVGGTRDQMLSNANAQLADIKKMIADPSTKLSSTQSDSFSKQLGTASTKLASISNPTTTQTQPSDALKDMSIGLANTQTPEDWAKAFLDAQQANNPDTSGVGTQSTQGDATAGVQPGVNDVVAGAVGAGVANGTGVGADTGLQPGQVTPGGTLMTGGTPMATVATGGYQKIGPAYFQKTSSGMSAVSDPTIISGLKHGTIPFSTGQLDGTTFSKYSVPLVDQGKAMATMPTPTTDEGASTANTYESMKNKYGLESGQTDFFEDPMGTVKSMVEKIYTMSGVSEANDVIKEITGDLEDLENDRDDEIGDVNDNPWLTEGVRLRQIASIENRYEDKIANRTNKLKLLEDVRNNAQQQAQFAVGTAISLWDKQRTFQQHQIDSWNEQAQNAIENDFKLKAYDLEKDTSFVNAFIDAKEKGYKGNFFEFTHPEQNKGTSDWSMFNTSDGRTVMFNQRTGAQVPMEGGGTTTQQSEALNTANDIDNLIADPAFSSTYGLSNMVNRNIPGSPAYAVAQNHENLLASLALGARGKLKGQGAVSDFEGKLLRRAQTSLTLNMNPQQARFELTQVSGAIRTSSGLTAQVRITAPNGQSKVGPADQNTITQAISNGYRVQYE